MRFIGITLAAFMMVGCVSQEGVTIGTSDWGVEEIVEQRESREQSDNQTSGDVPTDLVAIGTVSAFRPLTDTNVEGIYAKYLEFSKRVHPDEQPAYSRVEFGSKVAGWTRLKIFTIPLVIGKYEYALVPSGMDTEIRFPSGFGTTMIQEAGDLLAARTNRDGYFIVRQVLCKDGKGYSECAENYYKGLFDGSTGKELKATKLVPKDAGKRIDPVSFKKSEL